MRISSPVAPPQSLPVLSSHPDATSFESLEKATESAASTVWVANRYFQSNPGTALEPGYRDDGTCNSSSWVLELRLNPHRFLLTEE
ncbi:hypothetical protein DL771_009139 [Monosporascus sp. 5C6A]|nr:hypothetical protein DL771_009139 [Monosporascus sp. 5C6A]